MISEPVVRSAQTVHLSCIKTCSISKQTESSIHLSLVTKEYHHVRPKWFLSLCYVRHKPCAYLASRLALYQIKLNQASTWALSPRSIIGCVQNDFWVYGMFSTNCAPILNWHRHYLQMDQNEIPHDPRHLGVPSVASKMISKAMVHLAQTVHLSYIKISTITEQIELSFHLSLVT
jgi:hypothetical protein